MKLKISKEWLKIPTNGICTLYIPNGEEIMLESTTGSIPSEDDGILYRLNIIPICSQDNVYIKLPKVSLFNELEINYVNFI